MGRPLSQEDIDVTAEGLKLFFDTYGIDETMFFIATILLVVLTLFFFSNLLHP